MTEATTPAKLDEALSANERDVLAVLATATNPIARSEWESRVGDIGLRASATRGLYGPAFREMVGRLEGAGYVRTAARETSYILPDSLVAVVLEDAKARGRLDRIASLRVSAASYGSLYMGDPEAGIRLAVALGDPALLEKALRPLAWTKSSSEGERLVKALTPYAPATWIALLPELNRVRYLQTLLEQATVALRPVAPAVTEAAAETDDLEVRARVAILRAFSGDVEGARALVDETAASQWQSGACGILAIVEGRFADALDAFDRSAWQKKGVRRARGLPSILAVFDLLLAASPAGRSADAAGLAARVSAASRSFYPWPYTANALEALASFRATGRSQALVAAGTRATWIDTLVCGLAARWIDGATEKKESSVAAAHRKQATAAGYTWIAAQLEALTMRAPREGALATLSSNKPSWEIALDALSGALTGEAGGDAAPSKRGDIWWTLDGVDVDTDAAYFTAKLVTKRGSAGSVVSLRRLANDAELPIVDEDRAIIAAVVSADRDRYSSRYGGSVPLRALLHAVGHPRIRDGAGASLVVDQGAVEVRVDPTPKGARLTVSPARFSESGIAITQRAGRLTIYKQTPEAGRIAAVLGREGLDVPAAGLARALETLAAVGTHVAVRGVEALGESVGARVEAGDATIRVQIFRATTAFRARLRVVPGGDEGPALRPGIEPAQVLVAGAKGARSMTRDLTLERTRVERLLERAPLLASLPRDGDDRIAGDLESCLDLLLELDTVRGDDVRVEWPEGDSLRAPVMRGASALRVRVSSGGGWLQVDANLAIDEARVVGFAELVEQTSAARGRFVSLGDGQYLALTDELRERIEALGRARALSDAKGRTSLAMLPAIAQWADGADLEIADALRKRLDALGKALDTTPRIPRALQAELRDYQRDGFSFLARRASSGLGSCLADDMGLGKTVQALALLVSRAKAGPALVVAPTSVCRNWEDEGRKFAPTLTFHSLARAADRDACIAALGEGDVLLVSYGLLATSSEALATRRFTTAVFDEVHALKNPETRRAVAARAIVADAIVGLSGTPLENHLGELHALFDLLAPGLLGTRDKFERVFAGPIGRGEKRASAQLRTLVRPFLLRRTKSQVLDELPEKTEVTRILTPSAAERAFYEALRRSAVARVSEISKAQSGQARIMVLAEITKLRRAAVDPRLIGGDEAPAGAKLEALAELVSELKEEGHRALVFSQFLEVLGRAAEVLTARGVRSVRLDGTMNVKARAEAVDAFQSGQADVFLLSLKAGGVGMNLTAADYVVHLDPWWNPAVEDQATDRAHRIGQTRPVTVVRLVTEGTIEERVLAMHARKRAMYADAMGDLDVAKKLDLTALAELLDA